MLTILVSIAAYILFTRRSGDITRTLWCNMVSCICWAVLTSKYIVSFSYRWNSVIWTLFKLLSLKASLNSLVFTRDLRVVVFILLTWLGSWRWLAWLGYVYSLGNLTGDNHSNVGLEGHSGSLNLTPSILQGAVTCCATGLLLVLKEPIHMGCQVLYLFHL